MAIEMLNKSTKMLNQLKQSKLIQPFMPQLRKLRRRWDMLRHLPAFLKEESASRRWASQQYIHAEVLETAFKQVHQQGGYFSGWALAQSALRSLCVYLFSKTQQPLIVEFGSGQSTLFWHYLYPQLPFRLNSFEHDPYWYQQLSQQIQTQADFKYRQHPLKQLTDAELEVLWKEPTQAHQNYLKMGTLIPEAQNHETRLHNGFYDLDCKKYFEPDSIHAIVLDGPNGSGRSIAFALLYPFLKSNAWILIDDFDHYPFLDDLGRLYTYKIEQMQINAGKRWCLVRLTGKQP